MAVLDTISFSVETGIFWPDEVVYHVNGKDLFTILDEAGLDGGFTGPPRSLIARHPDQLLGAPNRWVDPGHAGRRPHWSLGDPVLYACGCGAVGCMAVHVHIEVEDETVVWSNFRDRGKAPADVGPFRFDRQAYLDAIEALWDAVPEAG